jgi:GDP-4-dehydro-6-deoxy-D-mannose reductase
MRDLLDMLVSMATVPIAVRESAAALRPLDEPIRIGNPARLQALGWKQTIPLERTLADILTYWRERGPD